MPTSHLRLTQETIPAATRESFARYPWCTQLLNDPRYTPVQTYHHTSRPGAPNGFVTGVLHTPGTIEASQSLLLRPSNEHAKELDNDSDKSQGLSNHPSDELITLYAIGSGLSGWEGFAHGGFTATLLDQQAGSLMFYDPATTIPRTAYCNINYVRAVPIPGAVKVSAWKTRTKGKKHWVTAELVDGQGHVLANAEMLFINGKPKL